MDSEFQSYLAFVKAYSTPVPGAPSLDPSIDRGPERQIRPETATQLQNQRRVGPWIDTNEFMPKDRPELRLHDPSDPTLRDLHLQGWVQRLVAVLDRRLAVAVDRPIVMHPKPLGGGQVAVVLFSLVLELDGALIQRTSLVPLKASARVWTEDLLPSNTEVFSTNQLSVDPLPWRDRWLTRYTDAVCAVIKSQLPELQGNVARCYADWLYTQMRRRHWTRDKREWVRAKVSASLGLNEVSLDLARRVRPALGWPSYTPASLYNRAHDERDAWLDVHRAAPTLLPLYVLVKGSLDTRLEPLAALRSWVLNANGADGVLQPRFWRWLQQYGVRWLAELREHLFHFTPSTVRGVLVFVSRFEFEGPASPALLRAVARLYGNPNGPGRCPQPWYESQAIKPLAAWWRRAPVQERQELAEWAPALANWMVDNLGAQETQTLARCSWRSARTRMRRDAIAEDLHAASLGDDTPLPKTDGLPPEGIHSGNLALHLLKRPLEIIREAQEMNHCARTYLPVCRSGNAVMASVLEKQKRASAPSWRKVATVLFRPSQRGWRVAEIAGRSNALTNPAAHRLAMRACRVLDARDGVTG